MSKEFIRQDEVLYSFTINIPIDRLGIECVQAIEKVLDEELGHQGFTRKTSHKGDMIIFNYWEFGIPG